MGQARNGKIVRQEPSGWPLVGQVKAAAHKAAVFDIGHDHIGTKRGVEIAIPERWAINSDEKMNFYGWLCEKGTMEDFQRFNIIFDLIGGRNRIEFFRSLGR